MNPLSSLQNLLFDVHFLSANEPISPKTISWSHMFLEIVSSGLLREVP